MSMAFTRGMRAAGKLAQMSLVVCCRAANNNNNNNNTKKRGELHQAVALIMTKVRGRQAAGNICNSCTSVRTMPGFTRPRKTRERKTQENSHSERCRSPICWCQMKKLLCHLCCHYYCSRCSCHYF